jgi:hypothetical protein
LDHFGRRFLSVERIDLWKTAESVDPSRLALAVRA